MRSEWIAYYGWVGMIIVLAWLLSFAPSMNKWFDHYVCLGATGAVALTFTLINVLEQGHNNVLFHAAMMYAVALYTTNFTEPLSYQDSAFLKLPKFP